MISIKPITGIGLGFEFLDISKYNELIDRYADRYGTGFRVKFVMTIDIIIFRVMLLF